MFDPKLYCEACRELRAPEDKIEEIITMTENTNKKRARRPLRAVLIAAAAVAMMVVSVAAANPEGIQALFADVASYIQIDKYRSELTMKDGGQVTVYSTPQPSVENRGGRAVLVLDGEDVADITDELAKKGSYSYETVIDGSQLHIEVTGTVEEWSASVLIGDSGENAPLYTITSNSDGSGESSSPAISVPDGGDNPWVSAFEYDGETITPISEEN